MDRWNWVIRTHFLQGERQCDCSWILGFWRRKEAVVGRFVLHQPVPCVGRIQSNFKRQEYRNLLSWSYLISNYDIYFSIYKFLPCRGGVRMTFGPIVFLDTFFFYYSRTKKGVSWKRRVLGFCVTPIQLNL